MITLVLLAFVALAHCQQPTVVQPLPQVQNYLNPSGNALPQQMQQQQQQMFAQQPLATGLPASPPYHPLFPLSLPLPLWNPLYNPLYPQQNGWQQLGWQQPQNGYPQNQLAGQPPAPQPAQLNNDQTTAAAEQTTKAPGLSQLSAAEINAARQTEEGSVSFQGNVPLDTVAVPRKALGTVQVPADTASAALSEVQDSRDTTSKVIALNSISSRRAEKEPSKREEKAAENKAKKHRKRRPAAATATTTTEQSAASVASTVIPPSIPKVIDYRAVMEAKKTAVINEQSPSSSRRPYTLVERIDLSDGNKQVFEGDDGRLFSLRLKSQETDAVDQILTRVLDAVLPMHTANEDDKIVYSTTPPSTTSSSA